MISWLFSREKRIYIELRKQLWESAQSEARQIEINMEQEIKKIITANNIQFIQSKATARGPRLYTPRQLAGVVRSLLEYSPLISAYMIRYSLSPAVSQLSLPFSIQGDIMIAFENIRAISPELAEKGAAFIAVSLCMMPDWKRARQTYENLGVPYTEEPLTEREVEKLIREQFVALSSISDAHSRLKRLRWDSEIKELVRRELYALNSGVATILTTLD